MKRLILFLLTLFLVNAAKANWCIEPIKPIIPIKPFSCNGVWTQVLHCDADCNCEWVPVCINE